jgi:hypothetical protein
VSWSEREMRRAGAVIAEIDACAMPRRLTERIQSVRIAVSDMGDLLDGIWGGFPVVFIRHLYRALGFDEHRVFQWRLEHKLIQALVLDHYAHGSVPATRGLDDLRCGAGGVTLREALKVEFPAGFYLKSALGDSSGDCDAPDRTERILACGDEMAGWDGSELIAETFIAQERIPIAMEYRVHSLEDRVIEDLTFHRYGKGDIPEEREAPNAFVQSILDRLPDGIVAGTLCGWDVARTGEGKLIVVEVNFSGFHPVHNRGFQCSGWFHDENWGGLSAARMVRFLEEQCGVRVSIETDQPNLRMADWFYGEVRRCREGLRDGSIT